jgi:hypothetical protein
MKDPREVSISVRIRKLAMLPKSLLIISPLVVIECDMGGITSGVETPHRIKFAA